MKRNTIVSFYKTVSSMLDGCCCCSTWGSGPATSLVAASYVGDDLMSHTSQDIKVSDPDYYTSITGQSPRWDVFFVPQTLHYTPRHSWGTYTMHGSALHSMPCQACTATAPQPGKDPACPYGGPREKAPRPARTAPAVPDWELASKDARSSAPTADPMYSLVSDANPKPVPPVALPSTTVVISVREFSIPGMSCGMLAVCMLPAPEVADVLLPLVPLSAMPGNPGTAVTLAGGVCAAEAVLSASGLGGGGLPPEGGLGDAKHAPVSSWHCEPVGQGPAV